MAAARAKRVVFSLAAVVGVPLALLAVLEGGLRLFGVGHDPGFFVERTIEGERVLTENPRFGWRFFTPELARAPQIFSVPAQKSPETFRICVLGGSAAMGDPSPPSGMPRILQAMLEECRPDLRIEVVNAAMTAINSHVVLPIARDCLDHGADLLVVYLGNNEVVGPFGAGSVFGIPGAGWRVSRANVAIKSTRTGQLLDRGFRAAGRRRQEPESWAGMELFLNHRLELGDPRLDVVYDNYRRNLADVCDAAVRKGVPVVVSSVGVNLRSCAPFGSAEVGGEAADAWRARFADGVQREEEGDLTGAQAAYREASSFAPRHAELRFRLGRCLLAAGDTAGAAIEFGRARDLDVLRFRADTGIRDVIRSVAAGREDEGVVLVDGEAALAAGSPGGLPGHELFDDHVHPNYTGNWLLGRAIARAILPRLPASAHGTIGLERIPSAEACAVRIADGPWKRAATVELMKGRRERPPFAGQIDAEEWSRRIEAELEELAPFTQPQHLRRALASARQESVAHPGDLALREDVAELMLRTDDVPGAVREREELVRRIPYRAGMHYGLGEALARAGRPDDAMRAYRAAIRIDPRHFLAQNRIGEALVDAGDAKKAVRYFRAAIAAEPQLGIAHRNLGNALLKIGRSADAIPVLERAIAVNPDLASAHKKLGDALAAEGREPEAAEAYRAALRVNPGYQAAQERLAELGS